ncbi:TQXA domain-containing protein [Raineyella sp. W15-4]|uniref:TQXA domain-containing protein n=1 Tax=Raineyella sp. W15-4 TaxID=3081651 RepID=UPI002952AB78|nr:TQXA domain-containing protein [Raineyella sp. W15-4]WOQ17756.1 TQXA domain-containing protein [Raineyella sp. W15-4]
MSAPALLTTTALLTTDHRPSAPVPTWSGPLDPVHHEVRADAEDLPERLSRYLGGLCSPTIQEIRLADGRRVRTDLVRLNPTIDAYSLDLDGLAPTPVSRYAPSRRADTAVRRTAPELGRIVADSYPVVPLGELSRRVRAAGYPLGRADLREHEAIAATQAALWHITNGADLDVRPRSVPLRLAAGPVDGLRTPLDPTAPSWAGSVSAERPLSVEITFDGRPQVGSYHVGLVGTSGRAPLTLRLERSHDGLRWQPVAGSERTVTPAATRTPAAGRRTDVDTVLGVGATLADGIGQGFPHYRLVVSTPATAPVPVGLESLRFTLTGTPTYVNPEGVVQLYRYLLDRVAVPADGADLPAARTRLVPAGAAAVPPPVPGAVGPFVLVGPGPSHRVTFELPDDPTATVLDVWGRPLTEGIRASELFFVRFTEHPSPEGRLVVHATASHGCAPRVLIGSRTHGGPEEFTPLLHGARAVRRDSWTFRLETLGAVRLPAPSGGPRTGAAARTA